MDINFSLGIIGIILTVFFGIIGILIVKKKKYKGRISVIKESSIDLYDSIMKNIDGLKIFYKDQEVNQNMALIRFYLINLGAKDISKEMIEKELELTVPEDSKILNSKIIKNSKDLKCSIAQIDYNLLKFELGLFRINEYCQIELLVETTSPKQIGENLNFHHRIADTGAIDEIKIDKQIKNKKYYSKKFLTLIGVPIFLLITATGFSIISYKTSKTKLEQERVVNSEYNGLVEKLAKTYSNDNSKEPEIYNDLYADYLKRVELIKNYNYYKYLVSKDGLVSLVLFAFFCFSFVILTLSFWKFKRDIKILSIIK